MEFIEFFKNDVKECVKNPQWTKSGVYVWFFTRKGKTYFYVGRSRRLQTRLGLHVDLLKNRNEYVGTNTKHKNLGRKYADTARFYILENDIRDIEKLNEAETRWIRFFLDRLGEDSALNFTYTYNGFLERSRKHREYFNTPGARENRAEHTRRQWDDPSFREINLERLRKLRDTGWVPTPKNIWIVTLPDSTKYRLFQTDFVKLFRIGCRVGGAITLFDAAPYFADWKIEVEKGRYDSKVNDITEFSKHPYIQWSLRISKTRKLMGLQPCHALFNGVMYKSISIQSMKQHIARLRSKLSWHEKRKEGPTIIKTFMTFTDYHADKSCRVIRGEGKTRSRYPGSM
jgi:hypothetical protein